jgi:hypothetical protein
MARWHGKTGQVKIGSTVIGSVRGWTLQAQPGLEDVTAFGDGNLTYVQGFQDVRGTIDIAWDDTVGDLSAAVSGSVPVTLDLYPAASVTAKHATGPAFVGLQNFQVRSTASVQGTYSFSASGTWTIAL